MPSTSATCTSSLPNNRNSQQKTLSRRAGIVYRFGRQQNTAATVIEIESLDVRETIRLFDLHPVMAETVNYAIQCGDHYCTLGCVAASYLYARYATWHRTGLYLLPFALALLSKPPAAVFPVLVMPYVYFFKPIAETPSNRLRHALVSAVAAIAVTASLL